MPTPSGIEQSIKRFKRNSERQLKVATSPDTADSLSNGKHIRCSHGLSAFRLADHQLQLTIVWSLRTSALA